MERKRDGFVPVGDLAIDLSGGLVPARRQARHFTTLDQVTQLVAAREADAELGFMARLLALCSLPRSNPKNRHEFKRVNGPYTLYMVAGGGNKLPYGTLPRLLLAWVCTEAVRTQSPELILGDSLSEFMRKVGIYSTSGDKHTRLRNQMRRLFGCTVSLLYEDARGEATLNAPIARLTEFWWSERQPDARSLWESKIELGEDFFNEIIRCPIPIDLNTLRAMKRSPLGLDLSLWLTYRPAVGGPHLRLELGGCQVAETHVGTLFVVVPPPVFDPDPGLRPIPKPFQRQAFVPELPHDRSLDQSSLRSTVNRSGKLHGSSISHFGHLNLLRRADITVDGLEGQRPRQQTNRGEAGRVALPARRAPPRTGPSRRRLMNDWAAYLHGQLKSDTHTVANPEL